MPTLGEAQAAGAGRWRERQLGARAGEVTGGPGDLATLGDEVIRNPNQFSILYI